MTGIADEDNVVRDLAGYFEKWLGTFAREGHPEDINSMKMSAKSTAKRLVKTIHSLGYEIHKKSDRFM
jgi:hypothetical protein